MFGCTTRIWKPNRSLWPRGLSRRSAVALLLGLRVRIPLRAWMCSVGSSFCNELISRSEEFYIVHVREFVCVCVCV
jgi:hypothetical protein